MNGYGLLTAFDHVLNVQTGVMFVAVITAHSTGIDIRRNLSARRIISDCELWLVPLDLTSNHNHDHRSIAWKLSVRRSLH